MIKAVFENNDKTNLILGISRGNVDRLLDEKSILVKLPEMNVVIDGEI